MVQGIYKIKLLISGLILLMMSLYPLTAYSQPLEYLAKGLKSSTKITNRLVQGSKWKINEPYITPIHLDGVTRIGKPSPPKVQTIPLRQNYIIDELPQVKHIIEVDAKRFDTNKEPNNVFSPEFLMRENEKPSSSFPPHHVSITPIEDNENAEMSVPINYINNELSTPISSPIDDNKWWLEYIENEIEKVIHKLNINIPFDEEKNVDHSLIFYYSLDNEYGIAA